MEIRNIADNGNVDRAGERAARPESKKDVVLTPHTPVVQDQATISHRSRNTLAAIEGLAERARKQGGDRNTIVAAARAKFVSGELSTPEAFKATAQRLLDSNFIAG